MVRPKKPQQQTLEATLGRSRVRATIKTPKVNAGSSSPAKALKRSSSPLLPQSPPASFMQSSGSKKRRVVVAVDSSSEDDSDDDKPLVAPSSTQRLGREKGLVVKNDSDDDDDDDDDKPLVTPTSNRRLGRKRIQILDDSDDDDLPALEVSSPIKKRRLVRGNMSSPAKHNGAPSSDIAPPPSSTRPSRKPLTKKEKARELLRRKRAGEVINDDDDDDELAWKPAQKAKGLYDTDSDNVALSEFEDDDEGVPDHGYLETSKQSKSSEKKVKNAKSAHGEDHLADSGEESDDFVVDDGDDPIGVPDDALDIPLQFTSHSHKPLKDHFRDVVEWLVQFKVNPGFPEKNHQLYMIAWQKLDDEVRGLAQSKFASAAWKKDFFMALRARPYFTNTELGRGDVNELENCGACGRSGHPAKWIMSFSGSAYTKSANSPTFLEPIEPESHSEDNGAADEEEGDEDEDGNRIPKESKQWFIGSVCNSNAETAHNLIHWKYALLDWVDATLERDGYMTAKQLKARVKMKPKQKYKLVDEILEKWQTQGNIKALYREFKETIETARNKSTSGGRFQRLL
ncbi:hypothetical protein B0T17DRAFT_590121 [Bombardia bombarda]|uniref:DUF4211 domain-containing protein n=1 Tax=Bombardia bombarda TaxID=252184 RepID=A0AA40CA19_9PEZI|nr:hypothetical protein B0T17DRAFT_590121 [Bombardia bombarda]